MHSGTRASIVRLVIIASLVVSTGISAAVATEPASVVTKFTIMDEAIPNPDGLFRWFSDPNPKATFEASLTVDGGELPTVDGFAYTVDRLRGTVPVMPAPGLAMAYAPVQWDGETTPWGPLAEKTLDMRGWLAQQTSSYSIPGMHDPVEGIWCLHARSLTATSPAPYGALSECVFGVDVTPPRAVANLQFADKRGQSIPYSRRDVVWDNAVFLGTPYDDLSGDSRFVVYLNDNLLKTTRLVRVAPYMAASIEDLVPGKNVIGISCMDYAGNEGPVREIVVYSDPDTPTVSVTRPTKGQTIGSVAKLSVNATDKAGVTAVRYEVDGTRVGTTAQAPFAVTADLADFSAGSHVLTAFATDTMGRTAKTSTSFVLDPVAPRISAAGIAPSTFFPFTQDGYKDYTVMSYSLSERARVTFQVRDVKGAVVYQAAAQRNAGRYSIRWAGQGATGGAGETGTSTGGTYYLRVTAADSAGNVGSSSRYPAKALAFEIKKTAPNAATVIPR
jgi:hypothetical protein